MSNLVDIDIKVVEDLAIRKRNNGEIRGYCCVCGGNDAFYNVNKLVWHCFNSRCHGRITKNGKYELKEIEIKPKEKEVDVSKVREVYKSLSDKFHQKLSSDIVEYLVSRGLKQETIENFKLGFCTTEFFDEYKSDIINDTGLLVGGYPILAKRLVIPYLLDNEVTDLRGRTLETIYSYKEGTQKYISLVGSYSSRGSNFFFNHSIIEKCETLILTEGEFKALVAIQYGFPVIATPGITRWNDSWTELLKDKNVILVADNENVKGRYSPCYIQAKTLAEKLPKLEVAILDKPPQQKKIDIDSYILDRGVDAFKRVLKGAIDVSKYLELEGRKNRSGR